MTVVPVSGANCGRDHDRRPEPRALLHDDQECDRRDIAVTRQLRPAPRKGVARHSQRDAHTGHHGDGGDGEYWQRSPTSRRRSAPTLSPRGQTDPHYVAYLVNGNDTSGINVAFLVNPSKITVTDVTQVGKRRPRSRARNARLLNDRPPLVLHAGIKRPGGRTIRSRSSSTICARSTALPTTRAPIRTRAQQA